MRAFILLTCLFSITHARPEAAGYTYNGLQRGLPQNVQQQHQHFHQELPAEQSYGNFAEQPAINYATPSAALNPEHLQQLDIATAPHANHEDSYNMAYQLSTNSHQSGGYPYAQQTTIHKHIYVHVPPKEFEDEDVITTHVHHQPAPKQKNYKIIFIKAPAAPSIRPPVVPPPQQNEEKTLIYVLHKRPDQEQNIVIPTPAPTKPSKPEVFFIKYKTKKEEAPVYGPPPAQKIQQAQPIQQQQEQQFNIEPRNVEAPKIDSFSTELAAPLATVQPANQDLSHSQQQMQQQQEFSNDTFADIYKEPVSVFPEEPKSTLIAPNNQYLAPDVTQTTMSPIIVEEARVPSNQYGAPNRFFLKKKK